MLILLILLSKESSLDNLCAIYTHKCVRERTVQKAFVSTKVMEVFSFKKAIAKAMGIQVPSFRGMTQGKGNLKAKLGSAAEWSL